MLKLNQPVNYHLIFLSAPQILNASQITVQVEFVVLMFQLHIQELLALIIANANLKIAILNYVLQTALQSLINMGALQILIACQIIANMEFVQLLILLCNL